MHSLPPSFTIPSWQKISIPEGCDNLYLRALEKERFLCSYFHTLNDKYFKLPVNFICSYISEPAFLNRRHHTYLLNCIGFYDVDCKMICMNMEYIERLSLEELMNTVRHELAHAIVAIRYNKPREWHGPTWIKVAKLLRVDTSRYINGEPFLP